MEFSSYTAGDFAAAVFAEADAFAGAAVFAGAADAFAGTAAFAAGFAGALAGVFAIGFEAALAAVLAGALAAGFATVFTAVFAGALLLAAAFAVVDFVDFCADFATRASALAANDDFLVSAIFPTLLLV